MLKHLSFLLLFLKSSLENQSLAWAWFLWSRFYYDSHFLSQIKLYNQEFRIKGISIYYTLLSWQTLLHRNQSSTIMYNFQKVLSLHKTFWGTNLLIQNQYSHCVKSDQIQSFFWSIFSHIWTDIFAIHLNNVK